MGESTLLTLAVTLSGLNLVALLSVSYKFGRWSGRVDTRLDHLEGNVFRRQADGLAG